MDFLRGSFSYKEYLTNLYGSIDDLVIQAQSGVLIAQQDLGTAYGYGVEGLLPKDNDQAIGWLSAAVDNGCALPAVLLQLGTLYDNKGSVEGSVEGSVYQRKAYELYHKAAELGCVAAELNLGEIYRCGLEGVVNVDLDEAFKWFKRAAGEGVIVITTNKFAGTVRMLGFEMKLRALHQLYKYYLSGECPEQQPQLAKALYFLRRAAELGDVESQKELGRVYMTGSCTGYKDLDKAERWLEKAAKKGDSESQKLLEECRKESEDSTANQDRKVNIDHLKQTMDIRREKLLQGLSQHPLAVPNPIVVNEEVLSGYPDSPTAQIYLKAYKLMEERLKLLRSSNYTDSRGLYLFVQGYLTENTILHSFLLSAMERKEIIGLATRILSTGEPTCFEGVVVTYALMPLISMEPEESQKLQLAKMETLDNLIHLIQKAEPNSEPQVQLYEFDKCYSSWLYVLFYHQASLYTAEELFVKGAEAFGKSLEVCPSNLEANIGLGYCLFNASMASERDEDFNKSFQKPEGRGETEKEEWYQQQYQTAAKKMEELHRDTDTWQRIKKLYEEYLEKSPKCAKKYPNACYHLAQFYMLRRNFPKMQEFFKLGQDAEQNRLPFLQPVDIGVKHSLSTFCELIPSARCSNPQCKKKRSTGELKGCPCLKATYCDRECQRADWKNHKSVCSAKQPKKSKK